ncbi:uncharacterized protein LTR77_008747 [Saxophila tyrrhenica]|uniref:Uncharacterized protein n=1 Tax=Saxophila tyrrhenica TaxID=1690608 RepID=A0AAV9P480_9PEZI|nr:hypothetical protein LTR77_008747 [Saxophila tyrrhenica]
MDSGCDDLRNGIRLANEFEQKCALEENSTDVRFHNLRNDISNLGGLLERLQYALQDAQRRYLNRGRSVGVRVYEPLSVDVESERTSMVGNFVDTLNECNGLLEDSRRARHGRHPARQEQRLEALRTRNQLHSEKIDHALDRLTVDLFTDKDGELDSAVAVEGMAGGHHLDDALRYMNANIITAGFRKCFRAGVLVDAPEGTEMDLRMPETFDAILLHLRESTGGPDQTPEKYLAFLKACWLLERLKASADYRGARAGYYYKPAVRQVEQKVLARYRRPGGLVAYREASLLKLPESAFRMWPLSTALTMPAEDDATGHFDLLAPRADEHFVACIPLASAARGQLSNSVTIFRSSAERFRLVLKSTVPSRPGETTLIPLSVHSSEDALIPRYAMPTITNPTLEMAIFSRHEETLFKFSTFEALHTFQAALTGYDVSHDQTDIRSQFSDHVDFLDCVGRMQLWQEPIILRAEADSDGSSHHRTTQSQNSLAVRSSSRRVSLPSSISPTTTVRWTAGGWEADHIKLPAIVIFTQLFDTRRRTRFATIFIELKRGIYIDATECGCCKDYEKCSKLVLVKERKLPFTVRVSYSDGDAHGRPNPNTFNIFPFRLPHPRTFRSIETVNTEYLVLKFRSLLEKQQFHQELDLRFCVRDRQYLDQRDFEEEIRRRQEHPQGRPRVSSRNSDPFPTLSRHRVVPTVAPIIDVPDTGPALDDAFARGSISPSAGQISHTNLVHRELPRDQVGRSNSYEVNGNAAMRPLPYTPPAPEGPSSTSARNDSVVLPNEVGEQIDPCLGHELPADPMNHNELAHNQHNASRLANEYYSAPELVRSLSSLAPEAYTPARMLYQGPTVNDSNGGQRRYQQSVEGDFGYVEDDRRESRNRSGKQKVFKFLRRR